MMVYKICLFIKKGRGADYVISWKLKGLDSSTVFSAI